MEPRLGSRGLASGSTNLGPLALSLHSSRTGWRARRLTDGRAEWELRNHVEPAIRPSRSSSPPASQPPVLPSASPPARQPASQVGSSLAGHPLPCSYPVSNLPPSSGGDFRYQPTGPIMSAPAPREHRPSGQPDARHPSRPDEEAARNPRRPFEFGLAGWAHFRPAGPEILLWRRDPSSVPEMIFIRQSSIFMQACGRSRRLPSSWRPPV